MRACALAPHMEAEAGYLLGTVCMCQEAPEIRCPPEHLSVLCLVILNPLVGSSNLDKFVEERRR